MKKQLNVRIPEELYNKLSSDSRSTVDVITELLERYYSSDSLPDSNDSINDSHDSLQDSHDSSHDIITSLKAELEQVKAVNQVKDERIKDLQAQLGWMQQEYSQLNAKLLYPAKPWWRFWRK